MTCKSDNPRGVPQTAEPGNQQERLISADWVVGFVDGEGCFSIGFVRQPDRANRKGYKTGFQVSHDFVVPQGQKSVSALRALKCYFGVGELYLNKRSDNHHEDLVAYTVHARKDLLDVIIPFFREHELVTAKREDFEKFAECMDLIAAGVHLTHQGLADIAEIAQTMNRRVPRHEMIRILRGHTPDIREARMKIWSDLHGDVQG